MDQCSFTYAGVERFGAAFIPGCFTLPLQHKSLFDISLSESQPLQGEKKSSQPTGLLMLIPSPSYHFRVSSLTVQSLLKIARSQILFD